MATTNSSSVSSASEYSEVIFYTKLQRCFLVPALVFAVTVTPMLISHIYLFYATPKHLKLAYIANLFNSVCYIITFSLLQPSLLIPTEFVLLRGAMHNRGGVVSNLQYITAMYDVCFNQH